MDNETSDILNNNNNNMTSVIEEENEYDPNISSLTDDQERLLSIIGLVAATLSLLGSSLILARIWQNRHATTPYDRLMMGLSLSDIISSFAFGFGPFLLPQETSTRVWAAGNATTCNVLGFFYQLAFSAVWYNGMLSLYYLLTVRFGVKRQVFAQRYEKWFHLSAVLYFGATATAGLFIDLYSELEITQACWIGEFPENCEENGNCISTMIGWVYGGLPFVLVYLGLPMSNWMIYRFVRRQFQLDEPEQALPSTPSPPKRKLSTLLPARLQVGLNSTEQTNSEFTDVELPKAGTSPQSAWTPRKEAQRMRVREVAQQGFMYVAFFYVAYTPAFVIRVLEGLGMNGEKEADIYWVLIMNSALLPLQGWFNLFIYMRPNYIRVRKAYPEMSACWALQLCLTETDLPTLMESRDLYSTTIGNAAAAGSVIKSGSEGENDLPSLLVSDGNGEDENANENDDEDGDEGGLFGSRRLSMVGSSRVLRVSMDGSLADSPVKQSRRSRRFSSNDTNVEVALGKPLSADSLLEDEGLDLPPRIERKDKAFVLPRKEEEKTKTNSDDRQNETITNPSLKSPSRKLSKLERKAERKLSRKMSKVKTGTSKPERKKNKIDVADVEEGEMTKLERKASKAAGESKKLERKLSKQHKNLDRKSSKLQPSKEEVKKVERKKSKLPEEKLTRKQSKAIVRTTSKLMEDDQLEQMINAAEETLERKISKERKMSRKPSRKSSTTSKPPSSSRSTSSRSIASGGYSSDEGGSKVKRKKSILVIPEEETHSDEANKQVSTKSVKRKKSKRVTG